MPSKVAIFKYRNKVKGSVVPVRATKAYGKVEVLSCLFVSLAHTRMWVSGQLHVVAASPPEIEPFYTPFQGAGWASKLILIL
jgi:hypothetical protein